MIILVPQDHEGIHTLIRDLPYMSLPQIGQLLQPASVRLTMPKFTVDYSASMIEPLRKVSYIFENLIFPLILMPLSPD